MKEEEQHRLASRQQDQDDKKNARDDTLRFAERQLQSKFKHAGDFGVQGNYGKENAVKFRQALEAQRRRLVGSGSLGGVE